MGQKSQILTDHYQKTYDLTLKMWEQRNTTFLLLVGLVGISALLTFRVGLKEPLINLVLNTFANFNDENMNSFNHQLSEGILHSIFLTVILFLLVILYHRNAYISRCYAYLAKLEPEIRSSLELSEDSVAFTRESTFYLQHKSPFSKYVSITYSLSLGILLIAFLGGRLFFDLEASVELFIVDILFSIPITVFYIGYVRTS